MLKEEDESEHLVVGGKEAELISEHDDPDSGRRNQNQSPENDGGGRP